MVFLSNYDHKENQDRDEDKYRLQGQHSATDYNTAAESGLRLRENTEEVLRAGRETGELHRVTGHFRTSIGDASRIGIAIIRRRAERGVRDGVVDHAAIGRDIGVPSDSGGGLRNIADLDIGDHRSNRAGTAEINCHASVTSATRAGARESESAGATHRDHLRTSQGLGAAPGTASSAGGGVGSCPRKCYSRGGGDSDGTSAAIGEEIDHRQAAGGRRNNIDIAGEAGVITTAVCDR